MLLNLCYNTLMVTILHSIVLGAIQGISEFLPISSSGHLILVPYLLHWSDPGIGFDVALHIGTAFAIVAFFWRDWMTIIANAIPKFQVTSSKLQENDNPATGNSKLGTENSYPKNFLWQIAIATIPAAILGIILDNATEKYFHSDMVLVAANLIFFGIVLWLVDTYCGTRQNPKKITYKQSVWVGFAQSIALIPGVSRSGITITASRILGLEKREAARFSFLLATPTIVGAFLFKLKDIAANDLNIAFSLGVISSLVFGLISIKYLLKYLERGNFAIFTWYRILFGLLILAVYFLR